MARERRSRAMWLGRFVGLQGRAKPDVPVTVPVVIEGAGRSGDARENRQGENGGKDGLHDHLLWVCLAVVATMSPGPDMARLACTGRPSHAPVTKFDRCGTETRSGSICESATTPSGLPEAVQPDRCTLGHHAVSIAPICAQSRIACTRRGLAGRCIVAMLYNAQGF